MTQQKQSRTPARSGGPSIVPLVTPFLHLASVIMAIAGAFFGIMLTGYYFAPTDRDGLTCNPYAPLAVACVLLAALAFYCSKFLLKRHYYLQSILFVVIGITACAYIAAISVIQL